MAAFSEWLADQLLDNVLRQESYVPGGTLYVGLFTSGTGLDTNLQTAEITAGNYARQTMAFDVASGSETSNTSEVTFGVATVAYDNVVTHAALCTTITNGQILYHAALDASKTIGVGDTFKFLAGAFVVQHQ